MNNTTSGTETVENVETAEVTETVDTEETVDTPDDADVSADVGEEDVELMTIEELLNLGEDDYEEFTEDANHKGMKPLHEWMQHIPEDVRKHVANIRSSYTQKTQELAETRRALENERAELIKPIVDTHLPAFLDKLESRFSKYPDDKFLCGDKVTIYDIYVGGTFSNIFANGQC